MKAVIPVAGIGSKLRPHTHTQPKSLIPVAGNTILGHIIDKMLQAGIQDFVFIIGYLGDKIEAFVKKNYPQINSAFIVQAPREGIGHALWLARESFRQEDEIIIMLGDAIVDIDLNKMQETPYSVLAVKKVEQPSRFGIAEAGEDGFITKLVEKPKVPKSNNALVGLYKIKHPEKLAEALEFIMQEEIKSQNEYHLTDALMHLIRNGEKMVTAEVDHWYDCGRKETVLHANAVLLDRPEYFETDQTGFLNTIIIPPVSIGKGCTITNSIIGPNVAIGNDTIIDYTILRNSIIGAFSELKNTVMHDSIVGNDASLKGLSHSLNIGDSTEINFNEG